MMNSPATAANSIWYGVETVPHLFVTVFTSIAIARTIGPEQLGKFLYV